MYKLVRQILFLFDPEKIHHFVTRGLMFFNKLPGGIKLSNAVFSIQNPSLRRNVFGLDFKNPVGLAAGFDKNGDFIAEMANLGFGFVEIGTVTPLPQPGNPKPRMFRLKADEALINRMGFNNLGVDVVADRIRRYRQLTTYNLQPKPHTSNRAAGTPHLIIGGNIGKNKNTPNEDAVNDYVKCFDRLFDVVDYFVVNVSSPNTPGLRELQEKEPLKKLLGTLQRSNRKNDVSRPILLKIAPDLTDSQLDDIIEIVRETGIAGVIATNTTINREGLISAENKNETGGLSGKPLTKRATEVIRYLKENSGNAFPIIGVGGIHTAQDAREKLDAGASLIQLYTGFVYEGPGLVKRICKSLIAQKN